MKMIFKISLIVIGVAVGFILGMTVTFALNSSSYWVLLSFIIPFTIIGGLGLAKLTPYLDTLDANIRKLLTLFCSIIAIILLLFLIVSIMMLKSYYQMY